MTEPRNRVEAKLLFECGSFEVLKSGDHVRYAVTGQPIEADALNYWSVEPQEVYARPQDLLSRLRDLNRD